MLGFDCMVQRRFLKLVHLLSTVWFGLSAAYVLVFALRQVGVEWWVIFSLSGPSAAVAFLLVSFYLFALFRGATRSQRTAPEHPLSRMGCYMFFYGISPFLGGLAGTFTMIGVNSLTEYLLGIALGTLGTTFLVWIVIDPAIGLVEMLFPASRQHYRERQAEAKALREKEQAERVRLLADLEAEENFRRCNQQKKLGPLTMELADILADSEVSNEQREGKGADIGVRAWQIGGLDGMQQLHEMAMDIYKRKYGDLPVIDYISIWWDGIGSWRYRPLRVKGRLVNV